MYGAIVVPCYMVAYRLLFTGSWGRITAIEDDEKMSRHLSRDALESKVLLHEEFMCEDKRLHAACGTL